MWGNGKPKREVIYVDDLADACLFFMNKKTKHHLINIGTGKEITIRDLVTLISEKMGYTGEIVWDTSKPDGQPRRCLDTSRAKEFGFEAETSLSEGLEDTIEWFNDNRNNLF